MTWKISHPRIEEAVMGMFISREAYQHSLNSACEWALNVQPTVRLIGYSEISVTGQQFEILLRACDVALVPESFKECDKCSCA